MIYAALVVSCMFVPTLLIKKLTVKWTMVVSIFCYSTYIAAQFHPQFYTLVPGAIILGLGAAPMWSAKCTYLSQVGNIYGELTDQPVEPIIVKFFGIFFLFFQSSSIWGNLISSAGKILRISPLSCSAHRTPNFTNSKYLICLRFDYFLPDKSFKYTQKCQYYAFYQNTYATP